MSSGFQLFYQAEQFYSQGNVDGAFEHYQKAIKKITKDENLLAALRALSPDPTFPQETLGAVWRNFLGFFKDPQMRKNKENSPEAYKLLYRYRPKSDNDFSRFRTEKQTLYLKGMKITAGLTLGLMAWDGQDRPAAAKYYRQAIDLAATHPGYNDRSQSTDNWERYVASEVNDMRDNLRMLLLNDEANARIFAEEFGVGDGSGEHRKDILQGLGYIRFEADGTLKFVPNVTIAGDKCGACGKREVKLMQCGACQKVKYCNAACQKGDWK
ncbi:Histone-lysine N-methyltransferase smyd1 [Marasmius crinis-equi]|uniref:Histone-lysine N-methyltransferase smyd1 n=1 Tax=Marasmius crinis-equi TaxID=585013 RepID=A0ABR3FLE3_9AGAR